jgi:Asp-tRNA(Asn)/Glu-tRNA(Gln) amidotransferase A subunit family amidase
MGKTVTTELATYAPGKTRNPHRLAHTPGGSSSGSDAAVACGMVPLALGSQTNGSTIRPGAYCGVVSFKPTRASIDRTGMLVQSPSFDTVGLFARNVPDVALLYGVLCDPAQPPMDGNTLKRLGWFPSPLADRLEPGVLGKLERRARDLGAVPMPEDLPVPMMDVIALHKLIMEAEIARSFQTEYRTGAAKLSTSLQGQIERGGRTSDAALATAQLELRAMQQAVDTWMEEQRIDAWLTPSAPGPAPAGHNSTGDPIFCTLATALDLPSLQLPGLTADDGLPLGTQVVARRNADTALLMLGSHLYQP